MLQLLLALLLFATTTAQTARDAPAAAMIDDFEVPSRWTAHPADGVELAIGSDAGAHGRALRLDFHFQGGGYAVARRSVALDLPENYAFSFRIRGQAPPNHLEFKLIDASGENVWWSVRRDVRWPAQWQSFTIKKRRIQFAWGPLGGGEIRHVAAIELAITAGSGGTGTVWIDDLEMRVLPSPGDVSPAIVASASTARVGHAAPLALDADAKTFWWCQAREKRPWLALDLGALREYGGLVIDWLPARHALDYDVDVSDDGKSWRKLNGVRGGNGGRDFLYLPEAESRWITLHVLRAAGGDGVAIAEVALQPLEWSSSRQTFFRAVAREAPRGSFPRGITGEQSYWTVVGVDGDAREGLLGEDGGLETGKGGFSIEPFLFVGGKLLSWADVQAEQSLEDGWMPIPTVRWKSGTLELSITAFGTGAPGASSMLARYRVVNRGTARQTPTLYLALRPFQVNPPTQALNLAGGTAPIRDLAFQNRGVVVNGARAVVPLARAARSAASTFGGGDIVADWLRAGKLPPQTRVRDSFEAASGALAYPLDLAPGRETEIDVLVPLYRDSFVPPDRGAVATRAWVEGELQRCRAAWAGRAGRVGIALPDSASHLVRTLRSQVGYILVNRAGPAIQPGARSYARSWIRDGALTSSALLRLGLDAPVREFIDWYAPHQYANGKIPCVVDARGADPVPEHDSSGEFVFLVAEYYRYTRDRAFLESMYPRVSKAVSYLDSLRHERRTPEFRAADKIEFYGLLPPSISHEGYSAKPMHSYWDDLFALRGFADAAYLAGELGRAEERARVASIHAEFEKDLVASMQAAMRRHKIDYIPGCADLGDFDATSTTIALSPVGAGAVLPQAALRRTFEKYWEFFRARRDGAAWKDYTPYEIRNIGASVHLGWRERAQEECAWFLKDQRPIGWNQWPEVVWPNPREARFLGDLPHTWVGSDFVRSALDMLAYVREEDGALVLGAGVPASWVQGAGIEVRELRTPYGRLSFTMRQDGDAVETRIEPSLQLPEAGIVVSPPLSGPIRESFVNRWPTPPAKNGEFVIHALPAQVLLRP